jgi:hypothetical protein
MNFDELSARLDKLGIISMPGGTIRRWRWQGLIEGPEAKWKGPHGGRGRFMEWPERAVEEIAAVWAVGHNGLHTRTPSIKRIEQIKSVVQNFYERPIATYYLPPIILAGPMRGTRLKYSDIKMRLAEDEQLHHLVVRWVIATEKAKRQWPMSRPAKVVFRWISFKKAEDGTWKRNQKGDGTWKFELAREEPVSVTKSDKDELVLWIDGHDSRWYFPVWLEPD